MVTDNQQIPDRQIPDRHIIGAWQGVVIFGIWFVVGLPSVVVFTRWAMSSEGWISVAAWSFTVLGYLALIALLGIIAMIGIPWVQYRKRVRSRQEGH